MCLASCQPQLAGGISPGSLQSQLCSFQGQPEGSPITRLESFNQATNPWPQPQPCCCTSALCSQCQLTQGRGYWDCCRCKWTDCGSGGDKHQTTSARTAGEPQVTHRSDSLNKGRVVWGEAVPERPKHMGCFLLHLSACSCVAFLWPQPRHWWPQAQRTEDLQSLVERCSLVPGETWLDETKPLLLRETFPTWTF